MSVQPPTSINRNPPAADRGGQRADRAHAGDFAALLDLAPAPAPPRDVRRGGLERSLDAESQRHGAVAGRRGRDAEPVEAPEPAAPDGSCHVATTSAPPADATPAASPPESAPGSGTAGAAQPDQPAVAGSVAEVLAAAVTVSAPSTPAVTPTAAGASASTPAFPGPPDAGVAGLVPIDATGPGAGPAEVPAGAPAAASATAAGAVPAPASAAAAGETTSGAFALPAGALGGTAEAPAAGTATGDIAIPDIPAPTVEPRSGEASAPTGEPALPAPTTGAGNQSTGSRAGQEGDTPAPRAETAPAAVPASSSPSTVALQALARPLDGMPLGTHRAVPLERAPRAVAQLLHVGSQSGVSHARIALRPVELGGIEIFLQSSPAGLVAQVVAESPEAARMLQQATEDLRRALARHDVELVSLDVSTSSEREQRDDLAARDGFEDSLPGGPRATRSRDAGSEPSAEPIPPTPTVLELPDGLLIDVLA